MHKSGREERRAMNGAAWIVGISMALASVACSGSESEGEVKVEAPAAPTVSAEKEVVEEPAELKQATAAERLVGKWTLDEKTVRAMVADGEGERSEEEKAVMEMTISLILAVSPVFEFRDGGALTMTMTNPMEENAKPEKESGTYAVVSTEADSCVIATETPSDEKEGETTKDTLTVTFDGDDKIKIEKEGEEMVMHLLRAS